MSGYIKADFWQSMSGTYNSNEHQITDPNWKIIEDRYNNFEYKQDQIPKIIHQIWLGGKIPDRYKKLCDSFKIMNPDWEYRLWTDEDVDKFGLINKKAFDLASNYGMKSDIFRYEIIERFGGVYADTDFECLKSLNDFIGCSFFSGLFFSKNPEIAFPNGLFGSTPNNPILKDLILGINGIKSTNPYDIMNLTGPYYFGRIVMDYFLKDKNSDIILFPTDYAYSLPSSTRFNQTGIRFEDNIDLTKVYRNNPNHYLLHYFHVSWQTW